MIFEFAIDPTVISSWDKFRLFVREFGFHQGRLIAQLPDQREWVAMVLKACKDCQDVKLASIANRFASDGAQMFCLIGRTYDDQIEWIDNAQREHAARPFRAIITQSEKNGIGEILLADDVVEKAPLFDVPRELNIKRTANEMLKCVEPLFQASREIILVDPHFNPDKIEFRNPLELFLQAAVRSGRLVRLEYHLSHGDSKPRKEDFEAKCQKKISRLLPSGTRVRFVRWQQREGGTIMHARYVLTELGGVRFDYGLDEGEEGETTDVVLLDRQRHSQLWQSFQVDEMGLNGQSPHLPYEYFDEVTIQGRR